ncbi:hypothetical protein C9J03_26215 [Photobacterium gaetbulicola]|uniref:helix-turn-helix domain-containing protein n=1 Tax=Photobacterium gaetbulicola TaxID=1295392 RepID=UPI000D17821A|nr:helix-turn-helix transcriptional regulator [Photobacterium gaetbulicola]PST98533.1 hypothetical protein C9J03_26215 [Photobacterium gaetbulicola]
MADDLSKDVGSFIRLKREGLSFSQVDCSVKADIARSTMRDLEQGKRLPNGRELISLSSVLRVTPNEILSAGNKNVDFKNDRLQQTSSEIVCHLAQTLFSFSRLKRSNKELMKEILFVMACGDLTQKDRADFLEHYNNMPEYIDDFSVAVSVLDELMTSAINPETGKPFLDTSLMKDAKASLENFYSGSGTGKDLLGMLFGGGGKLMLMPAFVEFVKSQQESQVD